MSVSMLHESNKPMMLKLDANLTTNNTESQSDNISPKDNPNCISSIVKKVRNETDETHFLPSSMGVFLYIQESGLQKISCP